MAQCLEERLSTGADLICWTPLSKQRRRERGFDQAELLAREVGRLASILVEPVLSKQRNTVPQSELEEEGARRANARGAYALLPGTDMVGKRVVLVDEFHLINILYNYQNRPESCGSYTPLCIIT